MRPFAPIAIVGRACILPGSLTPAALWDNIVAGNDLLGPSPVGRWRADPARVMRENTSYGPWQDRAGYVTGFEDIFDPEGFAVSARDLQGLDPLFHWVLHAARQALGETQRGDGPAGAVLGNLLLPSDGFARWAEHAWLSAQDPACGVGTGGPVDPRNRFMSGLPAHLLARALGLDAGAFALDAACASSLYAIKLACDRLQDGSASLMLAGAVNRVDQLFLHIGFSALQALSPSGQSRPFHSGADGLVPTEGCAFVALKRLADAEAAGDTIHGVIRGIGLSNDGRGEGLLVPRAEGQMRAMRQAYQSAGLSPSEIGLVECHATGTPRGDSTEVASLSEIFAGCDGVPIGSAKSNLGHSITVAGLTGLLKVLAALEQEILPPTLYTDQPIPVLANAPLRLLDKTEPWCGPRRAAVSAFGFGGNNAHLLVEAYDMPRTMVPVAAPPAPQRIAIVGIGIRAADLPDRDAFADALFTGQSQLVAGEAATTRIRLPLQGLRFPPRDLEQALPQQTLMLAAAGEALKDLAPIERSRVMVLAGMQTDPTIARYGLRARLPEFAPNASAEWLAEALPAIWGGLTSAAVVGCLPNIVANRLNAQFDFAGPSFALSSETATGRDALALACRALGADEADAVVVGAVDLSVEAVHAAAADTQALGDTAAVLVLKRLADAERDGDRIFAVLDGDTSEATDALRLAEKDVAGLFGEAHVATGLLSVAAAALAVDAHVLPGAQAQPWLSDRTPRSAIVTNNAGSPLHLVEAAAQAPSWRPTDRPKLHVFSGTDQADLRQAVVDGVPSDVGPARLVIVASDPAEYEARRTQALSVIDGGPGVEGVYCHLEPVQGEIASVFTGAAAAYPGMGGDLVLGLPQLVETLSGRFERLRQAAGWIYDGEQTPTPLQKLWGTSFLSQVHAEFARAIGLTSTAVIGLSAGESNALFATGAWRDLDGFYDTFEASGCFTEHMGGEARVLKTAWDIADVRWEEWRVLVDRAVLEEELKTEPLVRLLIIYGPGDHVIGGEAKAVAALVKRLKAAAMPLEFGVAVHCDLLAGYADAWRALHDRATWPTPGLRFYSHGRDEAYAPTRESAADALLAQGVQTLDFPALLERAYADGVRIFVEHGPQGTMSTQIRRMLRGRPHLAVAFDTRVDNPLRAAANAAAQLLAAGVPIDWQDYNRMISPELPRPTTGPMLDMPAHAPPVILPSAAPVTVQGEALLILPKAPALPPVLARSGRRTAVIGLEDVTLRMPVAADVEPEAVAVVNAGGAAAYIAEAHQAFLGAMRRQAGVHEAFLGASQRGAAAFSQTPMPRPVIAPPPVAPVPVQRRPEPEAPSPVVVPLKAPAKVVVEAPVDSGAPIPKGPSYDRAQLEILAEGSISSIFGPLFEQQDGYARQVRMPMAPMLLADRVTGIDAEPGVRGRGTIWTETDVTDRSWYLHDGRMPAGIMIESGQADLLLASWMGVDFENRGERVYRLLGCELTYHGPLPTVGETLCYDIHIDQHARQGDIRLFFFRYNCRIGGQMRLSVRNGQAGFFTIADMEDSGGVLWDAETGDRVADPRLDPAPIPGAANHFTLDQVVAFSEGRVADCFGPAFAKAETHTRTPRIQPGAMMLIGEVDEYAPDGGPWGRGYLKTTRPIQPDDWFFDGHFKNDPCMPGTLMFEGGLQAMAFYMAALGCTVDRDGWRFEPVQDLAYHLRCRGQVSTTSRNLVCEIFVEEFHDGPEPTLYADILGSIDGLKAFHCRRMGLKLVPGFPIDSLAEARTLLATTAAAKNPVARIGDLPLDYQSLLSCAWGKPSAAFGPEFARFDGTRRLPRLPGPPYHFMTRIAHIDGVLGDPRVGSTVTAEYDVPPDAWYFAQNGTGSMPLCVVMEAALQPCGWLSTFIGVPLRTDIDLYFRNLDGTARQAFEIFPDAGILITHVTLTSLSSTAGMTIVGFKVRLTQADLPDRTIYDMETVFGFFPKEALASQVGLPATEADLALLAAESDYDRPLADVAPVSPAFATGNLLMFDRVTGYWPNGGAAGLGRMRAERTIDPDHWYFKAHFLQDPVQPGSLGIEAMVQLLQLLMVERGMANGLQQPRFQSLATDRPLTWKYRGQVLPHNRKVIVEVELIEVIAGEDGGTTAIASARLWVDGMRIYEAPNMAMRVMEG